MLFTVFIKKHKMTQPEVCANLFINFDMMFSSFSSNYSDLKGDPVLQEDSLRKWGLHIVQACHTRRRYCELIKTRVREHETC
jgi:hypothetical protein